MCHMQLTQLELRSTENSRSQPVVQHMLEKPPFASAECKSKLTILIKLMRDKMPCPRPSRGYKEAT